METEIINKPSGSKTTFLIVIIFSAAFIIYYSVMSMISPARKLAEIKDEFGVDPAEKSANDKRIYTDSTYLSLLKEKAFLQSRITMAETD